MTRDERIWPQLVTAILVTRRTEASVYPRTYSAAHLRHLHV